MASKPFTVRERVEAIVFLEAVAQQLNNMAAALAERGAWNEADAIDVASKNLLASCWWIDRPLRGQLPPQRWHDGGTGSAVPSQQPADQQGQP